MRYKALAKRFKQAIDLEDPVPVAYAIAAAETPIEVIAGNPEGGRPTEAAKMQSRCGQISGGGNGEAPRGVQLRCGPKLRVENEACVVNGACVVEALTPEGFDMVCGSAHVADGCRRMIRLLVAVDNTRTFLARCQATKRNLDERLAMLLEPDMTPTSPRNALPKRGRRVSPLRSNPSSALA